MVCLCSTWYQLGSFKHLQSVGRSARGWVTLDRLAHPLLRKLAGAIKGTPQFSMWHLSSPCGISSSGELHWASLNDGEMFREKKSTRCNCPDMEFYGSDSLNQPGFKGWENRLHPLMGEVTKKPSQEKWLQGDMLCWDHYTINLPVRVSFCCSQPKNDN